MSTRPLVIYHANCADGFSAAWVFWRRFRHDADYHPGRYGEDPPDCRDRVVYLVDFSYRRAQVEAMLDVARAVVLIDHHKTAIEDLMPLFYRDSWQGLPKQLGHYVDQERSGATLAWDYLFADEPRPLLLGHIEDRDLWRFKLTGTREISASVFSHDYDFATWDRLMAADQVELLKLTANGAAIERKHAKDVREIVGVCQRYMTIGGFEVPAASIPHTMASDAGHLMSEGQPFAAMYWDTPELRQFSLRSRPEGLDVAAIAEQYGGGGHQHAAGFRVPRNHPLAQA